mgnify:CR=1 FL=1
MSCENCAITIDRVIGSPTAYKIKFANYPSTWSEERANNSHDPEFADGNRGAVIAQNVTDSDLQTTPLVIFVGGPEASQYADFWADGNSITLRFENQENSSCFLEKTWYCATTTTTQTVSDCCAGLVNTIETHGYFTNSEAFVDAFGNDTITDNSSEPNDSGQYEQQRVNNVRTTGFVNGSYNGAVGFVPAVNGTDPDTTVGDGTGIQVYPGTTTTGGGRICYGKINPNSPPLGQKAIIVKDSTSLVSGNVITTGFINIQGAFASGQSSTMVYVHSDGTCYSGDFLTEAAQGIVLFSPHVG